LQGFYYLSDEARLRICGIDFKNSGHAEYRSRKVQTKGNWGLLAD
jgi:hypothetical protein